MQQKTADTINVEIPKEFLSWCYRRNGLVAKVTVAFVYDESGQQITLLCMTPDTAFNIVNNTDLRAYLDREVAKYITRQPPAGMPVSGNRLRTGVKANF